MGIFLKIYILLFGKEIAQDTYKNSYYVLKNRKDYLGRAKRFIIYRHPRRDNSISSIWHLWLHYQISDIQAINLQISSTDSAKITPDFRITHMPYKNTNYALKISQSAMLNSSKLHKKLQLYQAWQPEKSQ